MRVRASLITLCLAILLAVPQLADAAARHYFDCKNCHLAGLSLAEVGGANVCLSCHGASSPDVLPNVGAPDGQDGHTDGRFAAGDASNYYGNNPAGIDETSHNWAAPTDVLPAAGAQAPTAGSYPGFYTRYGTSHNKITCSRCHNPHADASNPKLLVFQDPAAASPVPMDPNTMCLACHTQFAAQLEGNHGFLSHPMVADYDAVQAANPTKLKTSAEIAASGEDIQLINGGISCMTCHNIHYVDSDSSTADGMANRATLGSGDGLLLRADGRGITNVDGLPSSDKLCATCHDSPGMNMHGPGGPSDIGCLGCHGGHSYNDGTPTYYMLPGYTILPSTGMERSQIWGGTQPGVDGFCESCHGDIEAGPFNGVRDHTLNLGTEDCTTCHQGHNIDEPLGCDGCHGSPPSNNNPGNPTAPGYVLNGYAWAPSGSNTGSQYDYTTSGHQKDETATPHTSHSGATSRYTFGCQACHNTHIDDFAGTHNKDNTSFRDVLESGYSYFGLSVAAGAANPTYNDGTFNCDNVYCHSNGGVSNGAGSRAFSFTTVNWDGTKNSIAGTGNECGSCHGNDATDMGTKGNSAAHIKHLNQGYACNVCHVQTATSTTDLVGAPATPPAEHVNQVVDVAFDETSPLKAGGSNFGHGATPYSDAAAMTCSAVYCHSSGQAVAGDRTYQPISWTDSLPAAGTLAYCTSCHDVHNGNGESATHKLHVDGSTSDVGRDLDCGVCHADTVTAGDNLTITGMANHANGIVDIKMNIFDDAGNCSNIDCHSDGNFNGTVTYKNTPWGTNLGSNCDDCHGDGAGITYPNYANAGAGLGNSNSHAEHIGTQGYACEVCHSATVTGSTVIVPGGPHVDKTINVAGADITSYNPGTQTCTATCHGASTPQWGATLACGDCHAVNNTIEGSHSQHYEAAANATYAETVTSTAGEYRINCGICHSENAGGVTHKNGPATANYTAEVGFDGTIAEGTGSYTPGLSYFTDATTGLDYSNASCDNLYCHGNFGGNGKNATATWGNAASGACGTCHEVDTDASMSGGAHDRHVKNIGLTCDYCHQGTAVNAAGGILDKSLHVNQVLNWNLDETKPPISVLSTYSGTNSGTVPKNDVGVASYGNCNNVYCHSNAQTSPPGGPLFYASPNWGGGAACGSCHNAGDAQVSGSHTAHVLSTGNNIGCSQCHQGAGSGTTKHADFAVDVAINASWGGTYSGDPAPSNPYGGCSSTYCHSSGQSADGTSATPVYASPTWGNAATGACGTCHSDTDPATGSHTGHVNAGAACDDCHVGNNHIDQVIDVTTGTYTAGGARGNGYGTCSNASCHQDGQATNNFVVTPTWGVDAANCTQCHEASPTTGSHAKHIAATSDCATCHTNAVINTSYNDAAHTDLNVDVAVGGYTANKALGSAKESCSINCHSDGINAVGTSPVWGTAGGACDVCHLSDMVTGSHGPHLADGAVCGDCHNGAIKDSNPGTAHTDGDVDVIATYATANAAYGIATWTTCSAASCHDDGRAPNVTATWGTTVNNCAECHATQPATGSHAAHLAVTGIGCGDCHTGAVQGTTAPTTGHRDSNIDVNNGGYPTNRAYTSAFTNCTTASCHNDGQGTADGTTGSSLVATPNWGTAQACGECHPASPTSAKHDEHLLSYGATCGDCHAGAGDGSSMPTVNHLNGTIDVLTNMGGNAGFNYSLGSTGMAPGDGWGTCADPTTGCHGGSDVRPWDNSASSCNSCHGFSGPTGAPLVAGDMISSNPLGQHNTHVVAEGYGCNTCHNGHGMPTTDDKITISFTGLAAGGSYDPPAQWVAGKWLYNQTSSTGTQDCSNIYCHSTGQSADGTSATPSAYATADWGNAASGACGTCHANQPPTGSHVIHLSDAEMAIDCSDCHNGASEATTSSTNHVDGNIDVDSGTYTAGGARGNGYGTCSTATCHDDGTGTLVATPVWGTSAACTECHAAAPVTGSHTAHLTDGAVCADCHSGAVQGSNSGAAHLDSNIDTVAGLGYTQNKAKGSAYETCATASCHNDGRNSGLTGTWGDTINNCAECHSTVPATGGHGAHVGVTFGGAAITCGDCHTGAVQGTTAPAANHRDGNVNAVGYPVQANGSAFTTCTTATCHQTGQAVNDYVTTSNWDVDDANCTQCHAASPTSGSHTKHIAATSDCATCHTNAVINTSYNDAAHGDLNVDVAVGGYTANKALGSAKESCSINCHSDGIVAVGTSPVWGTAGGACDVCHLSDMVTGSHGPHLADGAVCGDCHNGAVKDSNPGTAHTDGNVDVIATYATANAAYGTGTWTTCSAASCHDDGRAPNVTAAWGTTVNNCAECHATVPATGSHASHVADAAVSCTDCHTGAVQGTTAPTAGHRDDNIDVNAGSYPTNRAKGSAFTNCTTASCHDDGRGSAVTATWGTTLANCAECHAVAPTTGSHTAHLSDAQLAIDCADCHAGVTEGTTAGAGHRDGNIDTVAGLGNTANKTLGSAFESCSTASCHDDGTGTVVPTPVWGSDTNCATCHATQPTTGSHTKHIVDASAACGDCHAGAVEGSNAGGNHIDNNIDTVAALGYTQNKTKGSAYTSCATVSCHGDGLNPGDGSTPNWGVAAGCAACHESDMTTGSHGPHLADGAVCGDCHTGAVKDSNAGPGHGDGNIDVAATYATANAAIGSGTWTTCSAASCHDDGRAPNVTAAWGTTVNNCAECHATQPATGSHAAHLAASAFGAAIACGDCHTGAVEATTAPAGHRDTNIDTTAALGYTQNKALSSAFESCGTVNCHSDGMTATGSTPVWGVGGDCATCHESNMATGSHTVHLASGAACGDCHNGAVKDSNPGTAHIDGNVDAIAGYATANAAYGNSTWTTCNAASCHDDGTGTLATTPAWGTTSACAECHADNMATGSHTIHLATGINNEAISCDKCHTDTVVKATTAPSTHLDGNVDVYNSASLDLGYPAVNPKGDGYQSCSATYCHSGAGVLTYAAAEGADSTPLWGATLGSHANNCDVCHGFPPNGGGSHPANSDCNMCHFHANATNTGFDDPSKHIDRILQLDGGDTCTDCHGGGAYKDPDTGDHALHTDADTVLAGKGLVAGDYGTGAYWYAVTYDATGRPLMGCGQCHPDTEATHLNGTVQTDLDPAGETIASPNAKLNNGASPNYNGSTCSNVYCHSNGAGNFLVTPTWEQLTDLSDTMTCSSCHGNSPTTNAHGVHEVGIHYTELYDSDGVGLMTAAAAPGTNAAHGDSSMSTTITCYTCHSGTVTDSANADNTTCGSCHSDTNSIATGNELARIAVSSSTHLNGAKDVAFATAGFKSKAQLRDNLSDADDGSNLLSDIWNRLTGYKGATDYDQAQAAFATPSFAGGSCSSVSCHNGVTATWTDSGVDCMYCHTSLPK